MDSVAQSIILNNVCIYTMLESSHWLPSHTSNYYCAQNFSAEKFGRECVNIIAIDVVK